jgi:hypothetical protein
MVFGGKIGQWLGVRVSFLHFFFINNKLLALSFEIIELLLLKQKKVYLIKIVFLFPRKQWL